MYSYKYPHPAMTADSVVFGFDGRELHLLLIERGIEPYKGMWALPGGFMKIDETIEQCAARELHEETGVADVYLEQFHTFSDVGRDPRERVVTVAFIALVRQSEYDLIAGDDAARAMWFRMDELPPLAFDHAKIIDFARKKMQEILRTRPIAFRLLDEQFSMSDLQRVYEAINETTYDRRNFAKKVAASGVVHSVDRCCETLASEMPLAMMDCSEEIYGSIRVPRREPDKKAAPRRSMRSRLYEFDDDMFEQRREKRREKLDFDL